MSFIKNLLLVHKVLMMSDVDANSPFGFGLQIARKRASFPLCPKMFWGEEKESSPIYWEKTKEKYKKERGGREEKGTLYLFHFSFTQREPNVPNPKCQGQRRRRGTLNHDLGKEGGPHTLTTVLVVLVLVLAQCG